MILLLKYAPSLPRIVARTFREECLAAASRSVYHWQMGVLT